MQEISKIDEKGRLLVEKAVDGLVELVQDTDRRQS